MHDERPVVPGYVLLERLGVGGSGEVWRAVREVDQLVVALKVVRAREGDLDTALREAAVLSRVHHPHLLHLYDVVPLEGEQVPGGDPVRGLALAVQLASGGSLSQVLAARHHLSVGELITVVAPVSAALADLHRVGIVHGDVSAGNVLFLGDGMPMLGDVGVARLVGEPVAVVHGTDGMVAPEVIEGFAPGPEADVYAVGALAWMCLTGEPPGWVATRPDLEDLAPELAEDVRDLVQRCLAPEPEDRPDAEEVSLAVFSLGRPEPVEVAPQVESGQSLTRRLRAAASQDGDDPAPGRAGLPRHRFSAAVHSAGRHRSRLLLAVSVGALVLVAVLGWGGVLPWGPGPSEQPQGVAVVTHTPDQSGARADTTAPAQVEDRSLTGVVQGLVDARAHAWEVGEPALLGEAMAAGSPAWEVDHADLVAAAEKGVGYRGVDFTVDRAELVGPGRWEDVVGSAARRVSVDLVVSTGEIEVGRPGELVTEAPTDDRVQVELAKDGDRWLLWAWSS